MNRKLIMTTALDGSREVHVIEHEKSTDGRCCFHYEEQWVPTESGFSVTSYRLVPSIVQYPVAHFNYADAPADVRATFLSRSPQYAR